MFDCRCVVRWTLLSLMSGCLMTAPASWAQESSAGKHSSAKNPSVAAAQLPQWPGKPSEWKGYQRFDFQVAGRAAYVVRPKQAAPGNPWVWRARFPNFHTGADLILLKRGFHVARFDTDGMLGSPASMEHWDKFYQFVVQRGLAGRCALEGVSRGGLFVYGFAKRWPERVACIYADTPVCDIRSWPGGKGKGRGDERTWRSCLQQYGLTEEAAVEFADHPVDYAKQLVEAKIPLLHIVSLNDQIVPPEENTFVLKERVESLGGRLDVIELAKGTEKSGGHHFDHPDPVRVADFIERHASVLSESRDDYFQVRGQLSQLASKWRQSKTARVAFVGGSITKMSGWREMTMEYLQQRFPDTQFEFIDAGIPSTGSVPGAFRLYHDVLSKGKVDLMFEEASVNDPTNGRTPTQMIRGMEGIVRRAKQDNPEMAIVMMHFVSPQHMRDYRSGTVPVTIQQHERVARHYDVTTIDLAREVTERIDAGQFDWKHDFRDLHPSRFGHRLYAASIRRCLSDAFDMVTHAAQRVLPEPIDPYSYDRADYVPLNSAELMEGFQQLPKVDPRAGGVGGGVRPGFHDVPMLVGKEGGSFSLTFRGRAVGLFVAAGPDAAKIQYRISQKEWKTLDLATRWSSRLHLPWVYVLADELDANQSHRLDVKVIPTPANRQESSSRRTCRIVHLLVNE